MEAALEGLLFLVGDDGLTLEQMSNILELSNEEVLDNLNKLKNKYSNISSGLLIKKFGSLYKLTTKNEYSKYYKKLEEISNIRNLSQSALETLAIIAYNEPITRIKVDELRGINSSQMIRNLIAKDFVKELGKSTEPGKPTLYGVTDNFLDYFGLSDIKDLPKLEEKVVNDDEVDLYKSKYQEEVIEQL